MKEKNFFLVCYDIIEDKRRQRVANILEDYGERVQYSVFECYLDKEHFEIMKERIKEEIEETEDKVGFYFFCDQCIKKREYLGRQEISQQSEVYIV